MLDGSSWKFAWKLFAVALLVAVVVVVFLTLLTFTWGFDLETTRFRYSLKRRLDDCNRHGIAG